MALTDPLGDMLTRIRNGQRAKKDSVLSPASKLRSHVLEVLQREGYIRGFSEDATGDPADRYAFRTSPLRNVALQPAFMHNGAFTSLEAAIRYHLDAAGAAPGYTPAGQGLADDLSGPLGPPTVARLDPLLASPVRLSEQEFKQLVAFVRHGLLDPRAAPARLRRLVPLAVPSGRPVLAFEFP